MCVPSLDPRFKTKSEKTVTLVKLIIAHTSQPIHVICNERYDEYYNRFMAYVFHLQMVDWESFNM